MIRVLATVVFCALLSACSSPVAPSETRVIRLSGNLTGSAFDHSLTAPLTISNDGNSTLNVAEVIFVPGGDSSRAFTLDWSSGSIASGRSQTVTVTFDTTTPGHHYGKIRVTGDQTSGTDTIDVGATTPSI
jgi:hypothetical protein